VFVAGPGGESWATETLATPRAATKMNVRNSMSTSIARLAA